MIWKKRKLLTYLKMDHLQTLEQKILETRGQGFLVFLSVSLCDFDFSAQTFFQDSS